LCLGSGIEAQMVQETPKKIETDEGTLELVPAAIDQLRQIAACWPMELVSIPNAPGKFGLVFQQGDQEMHGIKMQPADTAEANARTFHYINRALIASALPYYLEKQHPGVMVPCAYCKEKALGMAETGFSFFVGPSSTSASGTDHRSDEMYDDRLGAGATTMLFDMMGALATARRETGLPMMTVIGVDLRPRLDMGALAMHFVVVGQRTFAVKDPLDESEPVWSYLVKAGLSRLPYAPMRPTGISGAPPAEPHRE
jgi:hypothetical protein